MNLRLIIIGLIFSGYGIFSGVIRVKKPEYFKKLEPMIKAYGDKIGNRVHFIGYVIVPVIFGFVLIISGITGVKLL